MSVTRRPSIHLFLILGQCAMWSTAAQAQDADAALPPTTITSSGGMGESKRFLAELKYEYALHNDLRHNELAVSATPSNLNAKLTGMRGLAGFHYQPTLGSVISVYLGSALLNEMTIVGASPTAGELIQTLPMDSSVVFGAGAKVDIFPMWRFHLVPSFRYLRTDFGSTRGTLSNPGTACTYDYTSNAASTCVSPGQNTGGGVLTVRMSQNEFLFRLEAGVDIGGEINAPIVGIFLGVEESIHIVNGQIGYSVPSVGSTFEAFTFTSARTEGIYASLRGHAGPVRLQIEARGLTTTQFGGSIGIAF